MTADTPNALPLEQPVAAPVAAQDVPVPIHMRDPAPPQQPAAPMPADIARAAAAVSQGALNPTAQAKGNRSFFDDDKTAPASRIVIDGQTFEFDLLSPQALEHYRDAPRRVAARLGLTEDELNSPETIFTPEQTELRQVEEIALQDYLLSDALRSWSLPRNCNDENKRRLLPDVKRELCEAILGYATAGLSGARFRRYLDLSFASR